MDIGFVSAAFPDKTFEEVIEFASENGFRCVEIMCWPKGKKKERRYAGVTHIDADNVDEKRAARIKDYLKLKGVYISALGYYPNPLDPDKDKREFYLSHIKKVINTASLLGIPVVNTFLGRNQYKTVSENLKLFQCFWPELIRQAEQAAVKIAIENCPMLFSEDEWPGGRNLATGPKIWEQLFLMIESDCFGLNYDPSHLVWQQMNYLNPLRDFTDKLFHIHLKDTALNRDKLEELGILAPPVTYHSPKIPGHGEIDWQKFVEGLKNAGYEGPVAIELEDRSFEGSDELVSEGLLLAKKFIEALL